MTSIDFGKNEGKNKEMGVFVGVLLMAMMTKVLYTTRKNRRRIKNLEKLAKHYTRLIKELNDRLN